MRVILVLVISAASLRAQTQTRTEITKLSQELRASFQRDDFVASAELAEKLDAKVRAARNAWLTRDSIARADEVLSWLPPDMESFWVNQHPFVIDTENSIDIHEDVTTFLSIDRLAALDHGKFLRTLSHQTIRMVMAAAKGKRPDVAYFYFFTDSVDLGPSDESIQNHPVWTGVGKLFDWKGPRPARTEPQQRDDPNWITQVNSNLLVMSNNRELLSDILSRLSHPPSDRALLAPLPEWKEVDRNASFWGIRHYTAESKPRENERGYKEAVLPEPDGAAVGATVRYEAGSQLLEIRYLSPGSLGKSRGPVDDIQKYFKVDQPNAGVWRLVSDLRERDQWPMQYIAFAMLKFEEYR